MSTLVKQEYDPHLLYHAINITVELQYKVPMQKIYDLLVMIDENNSNSSDKTTPQDLLELLNKLGNSLESTVLTDEPCDGDNLKSKIKEILRLLNCSLSDKELNKILKGEVSLDDALSKQAKVAWLMIFDKDKDGKSQPNQEVVEQMLLCTQSIATETVEIKMQRAMANYKNQARQNLMNDNMMLRKNENIKTLYRSDKRNKEYEDPILLEQKRNKLRLYIAHMQGYDRDMDKDGGRGIDMTTGYVIDFGDIYIADKQHGCVIEDIENDGIEMDDLH